MERPAIQSFGPHVLCRRERLCEIENPLKRNAGPIDVAYAPEIGGRRLQGAAETFVNCRYGCGRQGLECREVKGE